MLACCDARDRAIWVGVVVHERKTAELAREHGLSQGRIETITRGITERIRFAFVDEQAAVEQLKSKGRYTKGALQNVLIALEKDPALAQLPSRKLAEALNVSQDTVLRALNLRGGSG